MHPILIQVGPFTIRWYGVMIALACLVGFWLAGREAERKSIISDNRRPGEFYYQQAGNSHWNAGPERSLHTGRFEAGHRQSRWNAHR